MTVNDISKELDRRIRDLDKRIKRIRRKGQKPERMEVSLWELKSLRTWIESELLREAKKSQAT